MSFQEIVLLVLFTAALVYLGLMCYRSLYIKKGCGGNCKCGVDFSDIKLPEKDPRS